MKNFQLFLLLIAILGTIVLFLIYLKIPKTVSADIYQNYGVSVPQEIIDNGRYFMPFSFIETHHDQAGSYKLLHVFIPIKEGFDLKLRNTNRVIAQQAAKFQGKPLLEDKEGHCYADFEVVVSSRSHPIVYHETFLIDEAYYIALLNRNNGIKMLFENLCLVYPDIDCTGDIECKQGGDLSTFPNPVCEVPLPGL